MNSDKSTQSKSIRIVGISITTEESRAPAEIGALWRRAAMSGVLPGDAPSYGVYSGMGPNGSGEYQVLVGRESDAALGEGEEEVLIPAGTYQVFRSEGPVPDTTQKLWLHISQSWEQAPKRTHKVDFERYKGTPAHSEVEVFVGVTG